MEIVEQARYRHEQTRGESETATKSERLPTSPPRAGHLKAGQSPSEYRLRSKNCRKIE